MRYFNIFGPRQSPTGAYAAVIPLFIQCILENKRPIINGDGTHSRDFTYVANAVDANILALFTQNTEGVNQVYNVACGEQTSLNQLWQLLLEFSGQSIEPIYGAERQADVKKSLASIHKIEELLNYKVSVNIEEGLHRLLRYTESENNK